MEISATNYNTYYQHSSMLNQRQDTQNDSASVHNNLKALYVDPDAINDLTLKAAHTNEILTDKIRNIKDNKPLKDINFEKESRRFDKSNIESIDGNLKVSQSNISSKRVAELLK